MQVFVPYSNFKQSAESLDSRRLNKQICECLQLLDILFDIPTKLGKPRTGWLKHPALLAWRNCPEGLFFYTVTCLTEARKRGIKVDIYEEKLGYYGKLFSFDNKPIWWGNELIHSSHRSRLLQKGWEEKFKGQKNADNTIQWYSNFNWPEMNDPAFFDKEYQWPVNITDVSYDLEIKVTAVALKKKKALIEQYGINPFLAFI